MKKDQVIILEKRGIILISGNDAKDFLQNIITNDINKVSKENSIFAALLTPQGKYLNDFFIVKNRKGYLLDCNENSTEELIRNLSKYKLRSDVKIEDLSSEFVIGVINHEKFVDLQKEIKSDLIIVDVSNESPAFNSGLKAGDKIESINDDKIYNMNDLQRVLTSNLGKSIKITVDRGVPNPFARSWEQNFEYNQNILNFNAIPRWNPPQGEGALGISISAEKSEIIQVKNGIFKSIKNSYESVAQLVALSVNSIKAIFNDSTNPQFSGPVAVGPVGISQITGSVASSGLTLNSKIKVYAELISILSLSLGIINLLPIPALDGGRILFVLIEILRGGRKVPPEKERIVHSLGFMLMIFLLILVTFQDISRIFSLSLIHI